MSLYEKAVSQVGCLGLWRDRVSVGSFSGFCGQSPARFWATNLAGARLSDFDLRLESSAGDRVGRDCGIFWQVLNG